ncbi:hypothetical protein AAG570_009230 [Ranatra chinensis]|uniref:HMG box domain-containing protein n=1 Tax=Ranatra chinensis TaxID=642074 RepID=A0ABD0YT72_9HEMI
MGNNRNFIRKLYRFRRNRCVQDPIRADAVPSVSKGGRKVVREDEPTPALARAEKRGNVAEGCGKQWRVDNTRKGTTRSNLGSGKKGATPTWFMRRVERPSLRPPVLKMEGTAGEPTVQAQHSFAEKVQQCTYLNQMVGKLFEYDGESDLLEDWVQRAPGSTISWCRVSAMRYGNSEWPAVRLMVDLIYEYRKEGEGPGAFATRIADGFRSVKTKLLEAKLDEEVTSGKTTAAVLWKLVREVIRRNIPERVRGVLEGLPKEVEPDQLVEAVLKMGIIPMIGSRSGLHSRSDLPSGQYKGSSGRTKISLEDRKGRTQDGAMEVDKRGITPENVLIGVKSRGMDAASQLRLTSRTSLGSTWLNGGGAGRDDIRMNPDVIGKTAFQFGRGNYEFVRMPFGRRNAPITFQLLMDEFLSGLGEDVVQIYMDDIIVFSRGPSEYRDRADRASVLLADLLPALSSSLALRQTSPAWQLTSPPAHRRTPWTSHDLPPGLIRPCPDYDRLVICGPGGDVSDGVGGECQRLPNQQHHHQQPARRPMNAFLIFCKRHRTAVKKVYPHLENRAVTKILGEWWANLKESQKVCYTDLANQYKEAYMKAHPDFRWYKMPAVSGTSPGSGSSAISIPCRQISTRTSKISSLSPIPSLASSSISSSFSSVPPSILSSMTTASRQELSEEFSHGPIVPGKLADESQLGGLSSLLVPNSKPSVPNNSPPKPPKKRYLEENYLEQSTIINGDVENLRDESDGSSINNETTGEKQSVDEEMEKEDRLRIWSNHLLWESIVKKEVVEEEGCKKINEEVNNNNSAIGVDGPLATGEGAEEEEEKAVATEEDEEERGGRRGVRARACKGRRYMEFMYATVINRRKSSSKFENNPQDAVEISTSSIRLRRRCREKSNENKKTKDVDVSSSSASTSVCGDVEEAAIKQEQEDIPVFHEIEFNLDERIRALPFLNIEDFQMKKKAKKKNGVHLASPTKFGVKTSTNKEKSQQQIFEEGYSKPGFVERQQNCRDSNRVLLVNRVASIDVQNNNVAAGDPTLPSACGPKCGTGAVNVNESPKTAVVGSRKRKARRQDIRRLQPGTSFKDTSVVEVVAHDNLGLVTLADVAAKKQKLVGQ